MAHLLPKYFEKKNLDNNIKNLEKKSYIPKDLIKIVSLVCELQGKALEDLSLSGKDCDLDKIKLADPNQHRMGAPLLLRENFPLDLDMGEKLGLELIKKLAKASENLVKASKDLDKKLADGEYSLKEACQELLKNPIIPGNLENYEGYFKGWIKDHPESPFFFSFIAKSSIFPSTYTMASCLAPQHKKEESWEHGHCPICGSLPFIGHLKGKEGQRLHTCSFCFYEYRVPRMGCPFCLKESQGEGDYIITESEPAYQIHVCKECKHYIKIADFREYHRVFNPMLDDLDSLILDIHAVQEGYSRPTLSAWGF